MENKKIFIIDGYNLIFRAFYTVADIKTSNNTPVNAVYGFINMLLKLQNKWKPEYLLIALDSGSKTKRAELEINYKANRNKAPDTLIQQFHIVDEALDALGYTSYRYHGYEADDIIASYTRYARSNGYSTAIISPDKDMAQLVCDNNPGVILIDDTKDIVLNENGIFNKFGVKPNQIVDLFAIIGDKSDNFTGINGIGKVTAVKLLNEFGSLQGIYDNIGSISSKKTRDNLIYGREDANKAQSLARLVDNLECKYNFQELKTRPLDPERALKFLTKYEMHSLIKRFVELR
jgi:DNA polymerase-1